MANDPHLRPINDPVFIAHLIHDYGVDIEPGWVGVFTRRTADGAIPSGGRVEKILYERGDTNLIGTKGTVLGSVKVPSVGIAYFIEWDVRPRHAMLTLAAKVRQCTN